MSSWTPRANKVCYPYITCHRWFQNLWYIFFYVYITIDNIFCIIIFEIFSHLHFCSNYFSSIMRHSSLKQYVLLKKILKFGYQFLPCNRYRINLLVKKKLIKFWPILGMQLTKSRLVLAARGVQLDNEMAPHESNLIVTCVILVSIVNPKPCHNTSHNIYSTTT